MDSGISAIGGQGQGGVGGPQQGGQNQQLWQSLDPQTKAEVKQLREQGNKEPLATLLQQLQQQGGGGGTQSPGTNPTGAAGGILQGAMGPQEQSGTGC